MPGDVPLDEPAGRLTEGGVSISPNWEVLYLASWGVGLVLAWAARGETDLVGQFVVTGLILAMVGWWFGLGRGLAIAKEHDGRRGLLYMVGLFGLFVPVATLVPDCAWMLFGLCPQAFMVRGHRVALGWVAVLNAVPPVVQLVRYGVGPAFWVLTVAAIGIVVFSHFVGSTIDHIARENMLRGELIEELAASRAQVVALSREAGVAQERERLAGEIHDTLAQGFTSILALLQAADTATDRDRAAEHLRLAADTARENLGEARALVGALSPAALHGGTLVDALRRQVARLREECGIEAGLDTDGDVGALPMPVEVALLRAAQEALTNVRRHSCAATALVRLTVAGAVARLEVTDDGVGFDPSVSGDGFGLPGMRTRVARVGGSVSVHSGPTGTVVRVEVPR